MASDEVSRRASVASSSEMSFADSSVAAKMNSTEPLTVTKPAHAETTTSTKLLPKKDTIGGVKLKKSIAKKTKPKDMGSNGTKASRSPSPKSPVVNSIVTKPEPREVCKHCKKPVVAAHFASHTQICLQTKKAEAQKKKERKEAKAREAKAKEQSEKEKDKDKDKDGDSMMGETVPSTSQPTPNTNAPDHTTEPNPSATVGTTKSITVTTERSTKKLPPKKSASKDSTTIDTKKPTKKRKADTALSGPTGSASNAAADKEPKKKKLKKETAPAGPKLPKPKGPVNVELQCGVLLTNGGSCARSLTCKTHSMGAKRAVPGRSLPYDQLLQLYQKKNQAKQQKALMQAAARPSEEDEEAGKGVVDSDEEREAVMRGLGRWKPRPVEQFVHVGVGGRYRYLRLKEMLGNALAGGGGGSGGRGLFSLPPAGGAQMGREGAAGKEGGGGGAREVIADGAGGSGGGVGLQMSPVTGTGKAPVRKASVASVAGGL